MNVELDSTDSLDVGLAFAEMERRADDNCDAAETCEKVQKEIEGLIVVANESVGFNNQEQIVRALSAGFEALLGSHGLSHIRKKEGMPAFESQQFKLNELTIAMEQVRNELVVANEAFFEDAIKWINTIGESSHNKMQDVAAEAAALLYRVKALGNEKPSRPNFTFGNASAVVVNGSTKPADLLKGFEGNVELMEYLQKEYPVFFRELCNEVVALYKNVNSLTTGVVTTTTGIAYVGFIISIAMGVLFALLGSPGLLVSAGLTAVGTATVGDVGNGILRWAVEKIPNERRDEMKRVIKGFSDRMKGVVTSYLKEFGKVDVNGNREFAVDATSDRALLTLSKQAGKNVSYNFDTPSKAEMEKILEAIIDSAKHYVSPKKATDMVNKIITDTEESMEVGGSKHMLTRDALSYQKQSVRQASTSLYFKTEGLYRKPMGELGAHQVRSGKALVSYVKEALKCYN